MYTQPLNSGGIWSSTCLNQYFNTKPTQALNATPPLNCGVVFSPFAYRRGVQTAAVGFFVAKK
jgi:hypothetical protein